jgi:hypothetical protein
MNQQDMIKAKIDFLSGNATEDLSVSAQDSALQQELAFVEQLWHHQSFKADEQPSANMDARFYQMLSQAQTAQVEVDKVKPSLFDSLKQWFAPKPLFQVALMAGVFGLGYSLDGQPQPSNAPSDSMVKLEQQVASLNSLVALSMVNSQSASKRLAGIQYGAQAGQRSPELNDALVKMLNSDRSTAIRLSALDALSQNGIEPTVEQALLASFIGQSTMVQIGLIKALRYYGSRDAKTQLSSQKVRSILEPDALDFLQQSINQPI